MTQGDAAVAKTAMPATVAMATKTLTNLLPLAAAQYGEQTAVVADGRSWSFNALDRMAAQVANALREQGIKTGDRVSLCAPNSVAWIATYHGALRCGAVINPLNVLLSPEEIDFALRNCGASVLLAGSEKLAALAGRQLLPKFDAIVALGAGGPAGTIAFEEFIAGKPEHFEPVTVAPESMSTICYTSGTTGWPKGAMQSHYSVVFNAAMTAHMHGRAKGDVVLSALPCPHVYGNVVMNSALMNGLTLVLHSRFEEKAVFEAIAKHRVTIFDGVPAMFMAMLNHEAMAQADLSSLRFCAVGGQTMPVAKMEAVKERFGCPLIELWGMTELAGLGTTFFVDRPGRPGSIGVPLPGVETRIADSSDASRTLARNEPGELMVRGPNVMMGYFGNDEATRETIETDGWLHTGDIGRMDEDGFVFIVDRKKDMILTAGYNIYPAELERVVAMHAAVAMVAVGPVPDDIKGEVPKAYIVLKRDVTATADEIVAHCRQHLAAYKIPRQVQFVNDLPKTSTGKIMRRALRSLDPPDSTPKPEHVPMSNFNADYVMTIGGKSVSGKGACPVYNPATREAIANVPDCTEAQLNETVQLAQGAFDKWRNSSQEERAKALNAMADVLEKNAEAFMALLTKEQGKPRAGAEWEILGSVYWLREIAKQSLPAEVVNDNGDRRVVTRFTPLGVVGGITPWNFPVLLAVWKIAPAIAAGNTIIIKPSPFTPLCTLKLGELCQSVLPPGVFNVVCGGDELGKWMTAHPGIAKIAFTGHTDTGKHVMRSAAGTLKRITLELGGNDPAIVLPDVDAKAIAPQLFWAAFANNAQFCNATKRLYVHEDAYDAVLKELVAFAKTQKVGNGAEADTALGPIQNEPQYHKVIEFFDDCKKNGYKFAVGGDIDAKAKGWLIPVTLVDNPPENSRIVTEEPFGPILPVLKWKDEADVIRRANDTVYGLGASVWGADLAAVERIGSQLDAGTVWLNEIHQYGPDQAFGGHKQSGIGCENSLHGLMEYTNWTTVTLNKKVNFAKGKASQAA